MKTLRSRLLLAIGLILLFTQSVSIAWVWHETRAEIELLVRLGLTTDPKEYQLLVGHMGQEAREAMTALFIPSFISIVIAIIFIYFAISTLTKPLRSLQSEIEQRTAQHLQPLSIAHATSEVNAVVVTLNQLLHRVELSLENERHFTADIAHELRTPLAGVRLNLELLSVKMPEDIEPLLNRIDMMMASIEQLLQLSRISQRLLKGQGKTVDIRNEVILPMQMEWSDENNSPAIIWEILSHPKVLGDSALIYLILRNLLENVRRYAGDSQYAIVRLSEKEGHAILEVIDEGPGVSEQDLSKLTTRFTRLDESKNGFGLGLNIVHRIVQIHQAVITIQNRTDRSGLHITITFPIASNNSFQR